MMKILIPVDGSRFTEMCLQTAAFLCRNGADMEIHIINVLPRLSDLDLELVPRDRDAMRDSFHERAEELLKQARHYLESKGLKNVKAVIIRGASPSEEILDYAEKENINLIIIGARGKSEQARFLLGAETPRVVKYAPCCVYVVKESCMDFCKA